MTLTLALGFIMLCLAVFAIWVSTFLYIALVIACCVGISALIGVVMFCRWLVQDGEAEAS